MQKSGILRNARNTFSKIFLLLSDNILGVFLVPLGAEGVFSRIASRIRAGVTVVGHVHGTLGSLLTSLLSKTKPVHLFVWLILFMQLAPKCQMPRAEPPRAAPVLLVLNVLTLGMQIAQAHVNKN